jgi:hypothetical protein
VLDEVALDRFLSEYFGFPLTIIILSTFHTTCEVQVFNYWLFNHKGYIASNDRVIVNDEL